MKLDPNRGSAHTRRRVVPLPLFVSLAIAAGIFVALAGRSELRVSPRPALLTQSFAAFAVYLGVLLIPIGVYFYVFHGDWFLLYLADVRTVPSALGMLGFMLIGALGASGFVVGSSLIRSQRDSIAGGIAVILLVAGATSVFALRARLSQVGSYAQFSRGFGLTSYEDGPLMQGSLLMGALALVGLILVVLRVGWARRRRG